MILLHEVSLVSGNMEANFARLGAQLGLADTNWEPEAMLQKLRNYMTHFMIDVGEKVEEIELSVENLRMAVFLLRQVSVHGNESVFEVGDDDCKAAGDFFGLDIVNNAVSPVSVRHRNLKRFMSRSGTVTVRVWCHNPDP